MAPKHALRENNFSTYPTLSEWTGQRQSLLRSPSLRTWRSITDKFDQLLRFIGRLKHQTVKSTVFSHESIAVLTIGFQYVQLPSGHPLSNLHIQWATDFHYSWQARRALSFVVQLANRRAPSPLDQWHGTSFHLPRVVVISGVVSGSSNWFTAQLSHQLALSVQRTVPAPPVPFHFNNDY